MSWGGSGGERAESESPAPSPAFKDALRSLRSRMEPIERDWVNRMQLLSTVVPGLGDQVLLPGHYIRTEVTQEEEEDEETLFFLV